MSVAVFGFAMLMGSSSPGIGALPAPVPTVSAEQAVPQSVPPPSIPADAPTADASPQQTVVDDDILVTARRRSPDDPLQKLNVESYKAVQAIDSAIVGPIAKGYKNAVPGPVRKGVHNLLDHIQEPVVFVNYLLQLKPGKAAETFGRFVVNSTLGVAGLIDVAAKKPFRLPHRPNSLADTLGFYGVKPGPFFFLPGIGPTTVRDLFGVTVDRLLLPQLFGKPFNQIYYTIPANTLSALDYRVTFDDELTVLHTATDPYTATRENYLRKRQAEIDRLHSPAWRARHLPPPRIRNYATIPPPVVRLPGPGDVPAASLAPAAPVAPPPVASAPEPAPIPPGTVPPP